MVWLCSTTDCKSASSRSPPTQPSANLNQRASTAIHKAISPARDRLQSRALALSLVCLLLLLAGRKEWVLLHRGAFTPWPLLGSAAFAALVWALRSATPAAAAAGALVCVLLTGPQITGPQITGPQITARVPWLSPPLAALITLFALTFVTTRFRRSAKQRQGLAEAHGGRHLSQVMANLGVAAVCVAIGFYPGALAALAEATADTVSSEIGQALGGPTWSLVSLRRVAPGTDGGISVRGTAAGLLAAVLVAIAGAPGVPSHGSSPGSVVVIAATAGAAGLLFDSLLGATLEQRGWLGNDLVNVSSTLFAALLPLLLPALR